MGPSRIGRFRRGTASVDLGVSEHGARCLRFCGRAVALDVGCVLIIIAGLIVLVAAVVAGVAGVLGNGGSGHALTHGFAVFGYHVTGSTGTLFLYGIVVGAIAMAGLSLLLAGARRTSRRGRAARRGLRQSRRETAAVSAERDDLAGQRETARASAASTRGNDTARSASSPGPDHGRGEGWRRLFARRAAPSHAPAEPLEPLTGQPAPDAPEGTPAPAGQLTNRSHP